MLVSRLTYYIFLFTKMNTLQIISKNSKIEEKVCTLFGKKDELSKFMKLIIQFINRENALG